MQLHLSEKSSSCLTERQYRVVCALSSDFLTQNALAVLKGRSEARSPHSAQGSCPYSLAPMLSALFISYICHAAALLLSRGWLWPRRCCPVNPKGTLAWDRACKASSRHTWINTTAAIEHSQQKCRHLVFHAFFCTLRQGFEHNTPGLRCTHSLHISRCQSAFLDLSLSLALPQFPVCTFR